MKSTGSHPFFQFYVTNAIRTSAKFQVGTAAHVDTICAIRASTKTSSSRKAYQILSVLLISKSNASKDTNQNELKERCNITKSFMILQLKSWHLYVISARVTLRTKTYGTAATANGTCVITVY